VLQLGEWLESQGIPLVPSVVQCPPRLGQLRLPHVDVSHPVTSQPHDWLQFTSLQALLPEHWTLHDPEPHVMLPQPPPMLPHVISQFALPQRMSWQWPDWQLIVQDFAWVQLMSSGHPPSIRQS